MQFTRELQRVWLGVMVLFGVMVLAVAYWVLSADSLLARDDNPRLVEFEQSIRRGTFFDRNGIVLAQTVPQSAKRTQRIYLVPSVSSALGYFSFRYGEGGLERAFNAILRGDTLQYDFERYFAQEWLHRPQVGSDVQLTLDSTLQEALLNTMGTAQGAGVIIDAIQGDILALASLPTFDPNTLDSDWEMLVQSEGKPFFNRVIQGNYQTGGVIYLPLMAVASLSEFDVNTVWQEADLAVTVSSDILIPCLHNTSTTSFSLLEAFFLGCPAPFVHLVNALPTETTQSLLESLALENAPITDIAPLLDPTIEETPIVPTETDFLQDVLGQGRFTANPLALAQWMSAIATDGSAPSPRFHLATRAPSDEIWQTNTSVLPQRAMITAQTAQALQQWLLMSAKRLPIQSNTEFYGAYVARSYSGEGEHGWFLGFHGVEGRVRVVVLVLENSPTQSDILRMGQAIFDALSE